jgi:MFS family permease
LDLDETGEPKVSTQYNKPTSTLLLLTISLGAFLFGFDTAIIGAVNVYIEDEWNLSVMELQVIVAIAIVGAMVGAVMSGWMADRFGRRMTNWLTGISFIAGSIIMACAPNVGVMIFGRFVVGASIGISSMATTLYIAEIAPPHIRGSYVSITLLFVTGAQLIAYVVGVAMGSEWRWMIAVGVVPAGVQVIILLFLPESPRWYVKVGRIDEAA